jgi:putative transcriptional regulator
MGQLVKDGFITLDGHSQYKITNDGVNWIIKVLKELKDYSDFIVEAITNISVCAAIAETELVEGQKVGLKMKDGLLFATSEVGSGARGIAFSDAEAGEDVGIRDIEGIVELKVGNVTILKVPSTQKGGSRAIDQRRLKRQLKGKPLIGAIGIEALVALRQVNATVNCFFGTKEAIVEAAEHGLHPVVACVEDEISSLIKRLEEGNIIYDLVDLNKSKNRTED